MADLILGLILLALIGAAVGYIVKAKKKGIAHSVKIYAKAKDGSGKKAVCTIKIKRKR